VPLFIGVDAPDFNLGLERKLKNKGVRTIHFVSPSVWAWRRERIAKMSRSVDRLLALFPFEPLVYAASGIPVTFVGHPIGAKRRDGQLATRNAGAVQTRHRPAGICIAARQSSRPSSICTANCCCTPLRRSTQQSPTRCFLVPLATRPTRDRFEATLYRLHFDKLPLTLLYGHAGDALKAADVALVASGTATLEAALARCPHVIYYRVTALTHAVVRRKLLVPWVGLPNVLAGRFVVPELLQDDATVENLAQAVLNLYDDTVTRHRLETLFAGFAESLRADTGELAADAVATELRMAGVRC
jgi:lipid-A-disaccharide synthase